MTTLSTAETVTELIAHRADELGDREMLRCGDGTISFAGYHLASSSIAARLVEAGVGPGDRVLTMMPNQLAYPVIWAAVMKARAAVVPVNSQYRPADLARCLSDARPTVVVAGPEQRPVVEQAIHDTGVDVDVIDPAALAPRSDGSAIPEPALDASAPADLVGLQYTSGTTGFPKACMLGHDYWLRVAGLVRDHAELTPGDVILTAQPFSYVDPQWNLAASIVSGATMVLLDRFSASTFWDSVRMHRANWFYVAGTMPVFLLRQPADPLDRHHEVRHVACGGAPAELHGELEERWGVPWREGFGQTESGLDLLTPVEATGVVGSGTMGWPTADREVRVVDPDGSDVDDGRPGEMLLRGPGMARGYWNRPDATADTWVDGWLHTGDIVVRLDDGGYRMVGRTSDMIRRSGENVAAVEVEHTLVEHPAVVGAAVVAVSDDLRGEEVKAFVQLSDGTSDEAMANAIWSFVAERLAPFKVPRFLEFVEEFPTTPSERIAKHQIASGPHGALGPWFDRSRPEDSR